MGVVRPTRIRWLDADPGRNLGSAADLVSSVADALGIDRFAVMGHSGGGSHALACGALLHDRVLGVVSMAGLAPFDAGGLDWFAGMAASGVDSLRAAAAGRAEKQRYEDSGAEYDPEFTPADEAALANEWSWLLDVVRPALAQGPGGLIDDDLAYVAPWGAEVEQITAPTLVLHGGRDRVVPSAHAEWLADRCPAAELRLSPDEGHISILGSSESALEWLREKHCGMIMALVQAAPPWRMGRWAPSTHTCSTRSASFGQSSSTGRMRRARGTRERPTPRSRSCQRSALVFTGSSEVRSSSS